MQIDQGEDSFDDGTISTEKAFTSLDLREFEIIKNEQSNMNIFTYTNNYLTPNQDLIRRIRKNSNV